MGIVIVNAAQVAASYEAEAVAIGPRAEAEMDILRHRLAEEWRARVKKVTGGTAASIGVEDTSVGSNAPDMHRLEVGFHGADSLGRVYDQAGQPALGPAFDLIVPEADAVFDHLVAEFFGA